MRGYDIIIKPVLTEKSYDGLANKRYVFEVAMNATKTAIKTAVEEIFGVEVQKVNTLIVKGKVKGRGRTVGKTNSVKKAYVQLTANSHTIEFFDSLK